MKKRALVVGAALIGSLLAGGTAFAAANPGQHNGWSKGDGAGKDMMMRGRGIAGTVTAVNGSTITVRQKGFRGDSANANTGTSYTVDASNATVTKNDAASAVSAITVGDMVVVKGTINGASVTAISIRDGVGQRQPGQTPFGNSSVFQGNGQPIVGGTVTIVNGSTITIANSGNAAYTVDASGAKIIKQNATTTVSSVAVGDRVLVQGTVNGSAIIASTVLDQGAAAQAGAQNNGAPSPHRGGIGGFFGAIGSFFQHLFGF